jgi:redox-sensitive bicupin YhaK (pirin superfamily)
MTIAVRQSGERLHTAIGWLDSRHTFSFAEHHDPRYMGFRDLRVLNEDRVAPGYGFGMHPHRDIEILTLILEGALRHEDSLGTSAVLHAGDAQRLTAGTGVLHSEFNASADEPLHLLQLWIRPERVRLSPQYEQRAFPLGRRLGRWTLVASRDGRDESLTIRQDVDVWSAGLAARGRVTRPLRSGRRGWLQVARGLVDVNGVTLSEGDGAEIADEPSLDLRSVGGGEALLIDLA